MTMPVKMSVTMQVEGTRRTKGRSKLIWTEIIRRDMTACNLMAYMALNRAE